MVKQKKAALELSVGTIVVIVIAMSMLILGLVLVRTIFTGAINNVDTIDDKVRSEIQTLFNDDQKKTAVYLANHKAEVDQGEEYGVAFAFRNLKTDSLTPSQFSYNVKAADPSVGCAGLTAAAADSWIIVGKSQSGITIPPGETYYTISRFRIPQDAPLCIVRYTIEVSDGQLPYATDFFDVVVSP